MNTPFSGSWSKKHNHKTDEPALRLTHADLNGEAKEFRLGQNHAVHIHGDQRGLKISLLEGRAWITQQDDLDDYVLEPGKEFTVTDRGLIVIESITESVMRLTPAAVSA